jgi:Pentapeptide repeats (9 copies)
MRMSRGRPIPWHQQRAGLRSPLAIVFRRFEWCCEWGAWALGNWAFLELLEYLGTFSVLVAVIFYFVESGDRIKQKHYQAWQVINSAQGKGGSGGRIEALEELNRDRVPLTGVDASLAFLQGVRLAHAQLNRCDLHAADMRDSHLDASTLLFCNLESANLRHASLRNADLSDAILKDADLSASSLENANLSRADFTAADLRGADLANIQWRNIGALKWANLYGVRNPPDGFLAFATAHGAVAIESDQQWEQQMTASRQ